ncbi:hypothetical protein AAVH_14186, partial [Aphelenchoides avenae]
CFRLRAHDRLWRGLPLWLIVTCLIVVPLIAICYRFPYAIHMVYADGSSYIDFYDAWIRQVSLKADAIVCSVLAFISFVLYVATASVMKQFRAINEGNRLSVATESRLLFHSIVMLFLQLERAFHVMYFSGLTEPPANGFSFFLRQSDRFFADAYCLSGSLFLLLISPYVRDKYLEFYRVR